MEPGSTTHRLIPWILQRGDGYIGFHQNMTVAIPKPKLGDSFIPKPEPERNESIPQKSKPHQLTTSQLADLRRGLLRLLDELGSSLPDENLAQRIQRMSRSNLIPRNVATCMHIIREMRNVAEYNAKTISAAESQAIEGAVCVIREWAQERNLALPDPLKENPAK